MRLEDLKPSITQMSLPETLDLHREIRQSRLVRKATSKKKSDSKKKPRQSKTTVERLKKDPKQLRKLLELMGEDV